MQTPVLPGGRLLLRVVHHRGLLLVRGKHLEFGPVTAQVVHCAEDRGVSYRTRFHVMPERWENLHTHYTPSWASVPSHQPHPENTWATARSARHIHIPTVSLVRDLGFPAYHCNVGVAPVAVIAVVNEARRLASQKIQRLLGQQSPGGLHDSAETSERRESD